VGVSTEGTGRLAGKVAVITGGASGMGKATTLRFCEEGARVVVADLNPASGESMQAEAAARGQGDAVRFIRTDVAEEAEVAAAMAAAVEHFGRLDVVFNNAGVGGAFGAVTEIEVEDWDYTFDVLVRGVFLGTKHGARIMRAQGGGGSIINTASIAGMSGGGGPQAYSAAKAAVINLTRSTAVELAPDRIRVNAICPGVILTPLFHRGREQEMAERARTVQPWPETGQPEDIAAAALFLASDESAFVTGHPLVVDGGLTAAGPDLADRLATRADARGYVGVNRGTTGEPSQVRRRLTTPPPASGPVSGEVV
jgi:NAD(P)-dependent dehydrogenase (short-subunit alcohol dehydrogenase family)